MRGGHNHKIMERPFTPKYGTVSQVLLQRVVAQLVRPLHRYRGRGLGWNLGNSGFLFALNKLRL